MADHLIKDGIVECATCGAVPAAGIFWEDRKGRTVLVCPRCDKRKPLVARRILRDRYEAACEKVAAGQRQAREAVARARAALAKIVQGD